MKIGVLTHPLDYNYGCLLQAFALQKVLKSMGHDVVTINRYSNPQQSFFNLFKDWSYRLVSRLKGKNVSLCWDSRLSMEMKRILSANTQKFVDRNIINTGIVFPSDLEQIDKTYKFDAYVVGSDQVWLPHFSENCFLDFVHRENVIKIFYAASSGAKSFADDYRILAKCKELSSAFKGISVREDNLIKLVKETLERDAIQVLDPTLLLDAKDYLDACVEPRDDMPVIFTYILDKTADKQSLIDIVQNDLNLPVENGSVDQDYKPGCNLNIENCIYPTVDHFILSLNRAKFVITDSFHGTCMSIVFRKPFVVVGNAARGLNRFLSVLRLFCLKDRLVTCSNDFNDSFYESIDTQYLKATIAQMRNISFSFLKNNLI